MSETIYQKAFPLAELPIGTSRGVRLHMWYILISRDEDGVHAINDRCPHGAALLSGGVVRNGAIVCPAHGARFELATGNCVGGAYAAVRCFPVRVSGDWLEVEIPDRRPQLTELPIIMA